MIALMMIDALSKSKYFIWKISACNCNPEGSNGITCDDKGRCSCKAQAFDDKCEITSWSEDCCTSIEVYYDTPNIEYSYTSIYGFYEIQYDLINGRFWYKNDGRSIWWDGIDDWRLGLTDVKGSNRGYFKGSNCHTVLNWSVGVIFGGKNCIHIGHNELK